MEATPLYVPYAHNYINGSICNANGQKVDIISPSTGEVISQVTYCRPDELNTAVLAARAAFNSWSSIPVKERVQIFYRYKTLLEQHIDELSMIVHLENGKTINEAKAEIEKSIEVTEFACSLPQLITGELLEVSNGVECRSERKPLGVVASITPFNFPLMVPHWTVPIAIACGNCMILKPSEITPVSAYKMAELLTLAGLPGGVFNVINGDKLIVEAICDQPGIEAISFVGSTAVAKQVYQRAAKNLKRCIALGGAKNHLIVLPDANAELTAINVAASVTGCAGQRCMVASAMVGVGAVDHLIEKICDQIKKIIPGENLGSVISLKAKERIERYITEAEQQGAKIRVDGRNCKVTGKENGFYVGPTVIDYVNPAMAIAREEVFGPVLAIMRTSNLNEALKIENSSLYGNAASVFTQNGGMARQVIEQASAGMIGVNVGVPVPREPFSFGGWNESKFGACDITGKSSVEFWTRLKKTTVKWNPESGINWMS